MVDIDKNLWEVLKMIHDYIRFSDYKAVAILGLNTIIFGILLKNYAVINSILMNTACINIIIFILLTISIFTSLIFDILSIFPAIKIVDSNSLIYFGQIAGRIKKTADDKVEEEKQKYNRELLDTLQDENRFFNEIIDQIWINSQIARKKYARISLCIRFLLTSIVLGVLLFITIQVF